MDEILCDQAQSRRCLGDGSGPHRWGGASDPANVYWKYPQAFLHSGVYSGQLVRQWLESGVIDANNEKLGYPPDLEERAVELVLEQAELLASEAA